jgi:hypothetical protein
MWVYEDGVSVPSWAIDTTTYPLDLDIALYIRDRLALRSTFAIPPLSPPVRAVPPDRVDVEAASGSWDVTWTVLTRGEPGALLPFAPIRFQGLTEHPALIAPWAWLYQEASAWDAALPSPRERDTREGRDPLLEQTLVANLENQLGRPVKPFLLEFTVLPVEGSWCDRTADGRLYLSDDLIADTATYTSLLRRLLEPVA